MTTFANVDVLTIAPNSVTARPSAVTRDTERTEAPTGTVIVQTTEAPATTTQSLEWICRTRAELAALTAFLDARLGQSVPAWIPTYQRDLEVVFSDVGNWYVRLGLAGEDFAELIRTMPAWQHWFERTAGGTAFLCRQFQYATDDGDGTYRLQSDPGAPPMVGTAPVSLTSAQGGVFSRLCLCRMARDDYTISYRTGNVTVVSAEFLELSAEA